MRTLKRLFASEAFQCQIRYYVRYMMKKYKIEPRSCQEEDDLLQEINLTIWRRIKDFDKNRMEPSSFLSYLLTRNGSKAMFRAISKVDPTCDEEPENLYRSSNSLFELPLLLGPFIAELEPDLRVLFKQCLEANGMELAEKNKVSPRVIVYRRNKLKQHPAMKALRERLRTKS